MKRLVLAAYAGALILTATACGDIEDPAPTTGLATVSSSTSSASESTTTTSTTTSDEAAPETVPDPAPVEEPAPEPDAPAPDERPAQLIAPAPAPGQVEEPPAQQPKSAYYGSCDAARSAGAAPLYAGDAGYRAGLDRDGDGVACE